MFRTILTFAALATLAGPAYAQSDEYTNGLRDVTATN